MITDRSKSQGKLTHRLTFWRGISKGGNSKGIPDGGCQFSEGERCVLPGDANLDRTNSKMSDRGGGEKEERPKRKRREKSKPLEVELDLGGGIFSGKYVDAKSGKWKRGALGPFGQF